jgi:hypothetical protein
MQHAETRQHILGPKAQRGRLPGWNCWPASPISCRLSTGAPASASSASASALASKASKACGLPLAQPRGSFAGQHHRQRQLFIAAAIGPAQITPPDLEQAQAEAPRARLRRARTAAPAAARGAWP